jgi:hypothetical protein
MIGMLASLAAPWVAKLTKNGLGLMADAVATKGKDFVEGMLGVDLDKATSTPEEIAKLRQIEFDHEEKLQKIILESKKLDYSLLTGEQKEITSRWTSDNKDGNVLTRSVRPLALIAWTIIIFFMIFLDGNLLVIKKEYLPLVQNINLLIYGSYFGGRTIEKLKNMRSNK